VAVFLLAATATSPASVHAVDHCDPATGFGVIARGLVGSTGDRPYVASPLHKQRYDLETGECLDADLRLQVWPVRVADDVVLVGRGAMNSST
jgi:nitrite reductase (NADH) small subunit